jgi:hypothetical protein
MAYDNSNSGLLAKNDRKEKDTHPDYRGSINIDGQEYWLSAWVKTGREGTKLEGQKYFSLSVQPKEEQTQRRAPAPQPSRQAPPPQRRPQPAARLEDMDDDIPF